MLLDLLSLSTLNDLTNVMRFSLFKSLASTWDDAHWAIQDPTKSDGDILWVRHIITPKENNICYYYHNKWKLWFIDTYYCIYFGLEHKIGTKILRVNTKSLGIHVICGLPRMFLYAILMHLSFFTYLYIIYDHSHWFDGN